MPIRYVCTVRGFGVILQYTTLLIFCDRRDILKIARNRRCLILSKDTFAFSLTSSDRNSLFDAGYRKIPIVRGHIRPVNVILRLRVPPPSSLVPSSIVFDGAFREPDAEKSVGGTDRSDQRYFVSSK